MQELLIDLTKLTSSNCNAHSFTLGQRIKFLLRKAKFQYHKAAIDSLKSSLTLLLSSLWYARAANEGAPRPILY